MNGIQQAEMNNRTLWIALWTTVVTAFFLFVVDNSEENDSAYHRFLSEAGDDSNTLSPLFPLRPVDYVGLFTAIVGLMLCAGGGIGGGGLLIPIFILVMQYPVKHAVSLSNVTVFGGAVANTMLNAPKRHPIVNRPLIDWNLLAVMEPSAMVGALVGAKVIQYLPDVLVIIMLVLLLGFVTVRTLRKVSCSIPLERSMVIIFSCRNNSKANQMHARESAELLASKETTALMSGDDATGSSSNGKSVSYGTQDTDMRQYGSAGTNELIRLLEEESRVPWIRISQLSALFLTVVILNIFEGSGKVGCGSTGFISLEIANIVVIVVFAICIQRKMVQETTMKQALSYEFADGDVVWDNWNTWKYSVICSVAGLCAGLFGIGKEQQHIDNIH